METLKLDLDQLNDTIRVYNTSITDLKASFSEMEKAVNTLKNSGWKSPAATAFFQLFDTSWKKNMERQLKIMGHLKSCLDGAKTDYQAVYEKVHTLGRNL